VTPFSTTGGVVFPVTFHREQLGGARARRPIRTSVKAWHCGQHRCQGGGVSGFAYNDHDGEQRLDLPSPGPGHRMHPAKTCPPLEDT
jgi:hypothetical protein